MKIHFFQKKKKKFKTIGTFNKNFGFISCTKCTNNKTEFQFNQTMNIERLRKYLEIHPREKALMLTGGHGIGKSQVVKQFADSKNATMIDIRLGQLEAGDIIGLPYESEDAQGNKITDWARPCWMPEKNDKGAYVIFFDELNRASSREVLQCVFQVFTDRKIHNHTLPKDVYLFSAINDNTSLYQVWDLDPALIDRFAVIPFEPSNKEWLDYAIEQGIESEIVNFLMARQELIDPPTEVSKITNDSANNEGKIVKYPSRRSWFGFNDLFKSIKKNYKMYDEKDGITSFTNDGQTIQLIRESCIAFCGQEAGNNFIEYIPMMCSTVPLPEIDIVTIEDVIGGYDKNGIFSTDAQRTKSIKIIKEMTPEQQQTMIMNYFNSVTTRLKDANDTDEIITDNELKGITDLHDTVTPEVRKLMVTGGASICEDIITFVLANSKLTTTTKKKK